MDCRAMETLAVEEGIRGPLPLVNSTDGDGRRAWDGRNKGQGASQANLAFLCNREHLFGRD